jgi:hypothetical protein
MILFSRGFMSRRNMAGYSGTPLVNKLGIKPDFDVAFVNAPENFAKQLELPSGVNIKSALKSKDLDLIIAFVTSQKTLTSAFAQYSVRIKPAGMFWVSWPKKASGVQTDLNENIVRDIGLATGLVDVKVCAVDEVWSGLKFVFRLKDRPKLKPSRT